MQPNEGLTMRYLCRAVITLGASLAATLVHAQAIPVAVPESYTTSPNNGFTIYAPGVMSNDIFQPGTTVLLVKTTSHGTLVLNTDGSFSYQPDSNFIGQDEFTYELEDSEGNRSAPVVDPIVVGGMYSVTFDRSAVVGGNPSFYGYANLNFTTPLAINVSLSSSNKVVASIPSSVQIPAEASSAAFPITTASVASDTTCTITATYLSSSQTATLSVLAPTPSSFNLSTSDVTGGDGTVIVGTINLNGPAPVGGQIVDLSTSDPSLISMPAYVEVPAGSSSVNFNIRADVVQTQTSVDLRGTAHGDNAYTSLTIQPYSISLTASGPNLPSGSYTSPAIVGGDDPEGKFNTVICTVTLSSTAPAGGLPVQIDTYSAIGGFETPATVVVPAGKTSASFAAKETQYTLSPMQLEVYAYYGAIYNSVLVNDYPVGVSLTLSNDYYQFGGNSFPVIVSLVGFAPPGGAHVYLGSNSKNITIPSSVEIPTGAASASFNLISKPVGATSLVVLSAIYQGQMATCPFELLSAQVSDVIYSTNTVVGGDSVQGTIILAGEAALGGTVVHLVPSPSGIVGPSSVSIKAGARSASFTLTTKAVKSATSVIIHAYTWAGGSEWWNTSEITLLP